MFVSCLYLGLIFNSNLFQLILSSPVFNQFIFFAMNVKSMFLKFEKYIFFICLDGDTRNVPSV